MNVLALLSLPLVFVAARWPGATGGDALALAALVADNAPILSAPDKHMIAALFDGNLNQSIPPGKTIIVHVDSITCSAGDVNVTKHGCDLSFGKQTISLSGRRAHELYATLVEVGVPSEGAAGTIYETLSHLTCAINVGQLEQQAGSGADCMFDTGPGVSK